MMSRTKEDKNLIVGLDIGTSKIVAIVAELQPEGTLKVIGLGQHRVNHAIDSACVRRGRVDGRLQNQ